MAKIKRLEPVKERLDDHEKVFYEIIDILNAADRRIARIEYRFGYRKVRSTEHKQENGGNGG